MSELLTGSMASANIHGLSPDDMGLQLGQLDYALLLPAFNEGSRIRRPGVDIHEGDTLRYTIEGYLNGMTELFDQKDRWALVLGDDKSQDNTAQIAQEEFGLTVIQNPKSDQKGRGSVLKYGLPLLAHYADVVGYTDADGSYNFKNSVAAQYQAVKDGADIVVAKRPDAEHTRKQAEKTKQHENLLRKYGHIAIYTICEQIAQTGIDDPQAGLQHYSSEAAKALWPLVASNSWAANREIIYLARRLQKADGTDYRVVQQEAAAEARKGSSVRILHDSSVMIRDSFAMRRQHRDTT